MTLHYIAQVVIDVIRLVFLGRKHRLDIADSQLCIANRIHEQDPSVEVEEPNVDPKRQRHQGLSEGTVPAPAEARAVA